ncbi:cell division control protein 6 homolog isoform X2 [Daphnia pulex]|uniref:cell division control protein 6 homolog isoform X2 n=1 Tax=Daphnia pulex TaxID=6669 RepID=UPI001EE051A1|nr:cell division control protein 6 homolog isoform X2 [Daphnia pulex]
MKLQNPNVTSNFTKARQALHTSTPGNIFCRDKELDVIETFLQNHIDNGTSGSMYISGRPGTGKTACVTHILANRTFSGKFKSIFINCMLLHTPFSVFQQVAQQLDPKWNTTAKEALSYLEDRLTESGSMIVLVLDEIDQMSTRDQSVLYALFELPALTNSRLILIGLANALDLTDRSLIRLQSRVHFKPVLLNFSPYSKQEIATIVSQRIQEAVGEDVGNVIAPSALQYLGGKISSTSGDLRKAIDICRRAVELAETGAKKQSVLATNSELQTSQSVQINKCVSIPILCKMMASVESNAFSVGNSDDVDETPLQQKLIIVTLLVLVKFGKSKQVTLGKLHQSYSKVCSKYGMTTIDFDEFSHTCSLVESRGIVTLKKKSNPRLAPICLRLDEREVESTLKDKTLLSSILAQGSLFL